MIVEVCEICYIADCRHIRARRNGTALAGHVHFHAPQFGYTEPLFASQSAAYKLLQRAHAVMIRCHWNEPTGLEGDEDSALQVERDVREFLGK